jgi:hypothetical protein
MNWPFPNSVVPNSLEDLMEQGVTRNLNGREIILAPYPGANYRIGWVYKDTGLPPTEEEISNDSHR